VDGGIVVHLKQSDNVFLIPQMIAAGNDVHTGRINLRRSIGSNARTPAEFSPLATTRSTDVRSAISGTSCLTADVLARPQCPR